MSLEAGGRSDKYGNEYEKRYLLRLLIKLIAGKLTSVVVEPLGENKDSVEYISKDTQGKLWHHQCKASNKSKDKWTPSDLNAYAVFARSKKILTGSPENRYEFVSPLSYGELPELCKRARTNSDPAELVRYQLTNNELKAVFKSCEKYYGLKADDPAQLAQLADILSRSYFETVLNGKEQVEETEILVSVYFSGDSRATCSLLEDYVGSQEIYGRPITAYDVISYMEQRGFAFRAHLFSDNIQAKLNDLNALFVSSYLPINDILVYRGAAEDVVDAIRQNRSVILHGKAGMGKSGCVQEVIETLKSERIPYLSLKLDKHIPEGTADSYGKSLGLEQSPVYCLHHLSGGNPCVFIIDQLDSLRWTSHHSAGALDICKQMIRQADALNRNENARISLLVISRTFDLETDPGLQSLFETKTNHSSDWLRIQVFEFTHEEVERMIGAEYNGYHAKLQKLLRTPSTLYIWTKLAKHNHALLATTVQDLMQEWWEQILHNCSKSSVAKDRIIAVKDKIVSLMGKNSSFSLQKRLFSDDSHEVDKLISEGLLIETDDKIAFVHQSFLDYFAAADMISQFFEGRDTAEIIGDYDTQTPVLRYRLIAVLQWLLEYEEGLFIAKSRDILNSDAVRYYFKFSVFEVAAQYESPSTELNSYLYQLFLDEAWHDVVLRVVYQGHLPHIRELDRHPSFDWLSKDGLELLRSVYSIEPDYVIGKLPSGMICDRRQAIKFYDVFSHDLSYDTPKALEYRLRLLEAFPELYDELWAIGQLVKDRSPNLLPVLKSMVEHSDQINKQFSFRMDAVLTAYSKKYSSDIIQMLLPTVCGVTARFDPHRFSIRFDDGVNKWISNHYHPHFVYTIKEMIKTALAEYYEQDPDACISFICARSGQGSVVYYGIISQTILHMDVRDSDFAIQWLYEDPRNHMFIYTEDENDYLATTKQIIKRFSPHCSDERFRHLEDVVFHWSDPAAEMVGTYKHRMEASKEYGRAYYPYWGFFQKELLPCLDPSRLSSESKDLLRVLNRNPLMRAPHYNYGISYERCGGSASPIFGKTERISDCEWLRIISEPDEKMKRHFSIERIDGRYINTSHTAFSASLSTQAKKEPRRFAKLALKFPENCCRDYITGVLKAFYEPDPDAQPAEMEQIVPVIYRYIDSWDHEINREILSVISHLSECDWPEDIIDRVCDIAIETDMVDDYDGSDDVNIDSVEYLHIAAINCASGRAVETMSKLLDAHPELIERFVPVFDQLCADTHSVVRYALMYGAVSCLRIDPKYALGLFRSLLSQDIRILSFHKVWQLILQDRDAYGEYYAEQLTMAAYSGIEGLDAFSARLLCAYAIFFDNALIPKVCFDGFDEKQIWEICDQAIYSFKMSDYHESAQEILLYYIHHHSENISVLTDLFRDNCIDIDRDEQFLIELLQSRQEPFIVSDFLEYINEQDQDISRYLHIIHKLSETIITNKSSWNERSIVHSLTVSVIKIFDRTKYDPEKKRICLDIWDGIYRNCYENVKSIADILDEQN